jgi:outer membrane immunogenic protein
MKKLLGAIAISAFFAAPALAADLPARVPVKAPPPVVVAVYNWTGFYIGVVGGWGRSEQQWTSTAGVSTGKFRGNGGHVGGTIGYNWQTGQFVLGLEADGSWSGIDATNTTTGGCAAAFPCTADLRWFGTARGRLGVAWQNVLFYGTGGAAFANIKNSQTALSPLATADTTKFGWTAGGGIEVGFAPNWSVKAEYLYARFGQTDFCPAAGCGVVVVSDYTRLHLVRAGLNYRFGGPVVARY